MAKPDPLQGLKDKQAMLEAKIKRIQSGEVAGQDENHTAEALGRAEAQLREVKKALADAQPKNQPDAK